MAARRKPKQASTGEWPENLLVAIPAFSPFSVETDRKANPLTWGLHVYPRLAEREDGRPDYSAAKYVISRSVYLQPMYVQGVLQVPPTTKEERQKLDKLMSLEFSSEECDRLNSIIENIVVVTALSERLPTPRDFAERLTKIIQVTGSLMTFNDLVGPNSADLALDTGVVSIDTGVRHYLLVKGFGEVVDLGALRELITICEEALANIKPLLSRKGTKPDLAFRLFVDSILRFALSNGISITLPSNAIKEKLAAPTQTPIIRFTKELLCLVKARAEATLEHSNLTASEIAKAKYMFSHYATMSDGAIVDHLRKAKKTLARPS